jgi:hypothetical protein
MESHAIVKELLKKVSAKHVAQELGVSLSLVYKWAEAPIVGSGTSNPLDRIEVLTRLANDMSMLEWLCSRFGGSFSRHSVEEDVTAEEFFSKVGHLLPELGHVLGGLFASTGAIEKVPAAKLRDMRLRWDKTKNTIESLLRAAERGYFSQPPFEVDGVPVAKKITPTNYKRSLGIVTENTRVPLHQTPQLQTK